MQVLNSLSIPSSKLSFAGLAQHVRGMKILTDTNCQDKDSRTSCRNTLYKVKGGETVGVKDEILASVKELEDGLCGLDLDIVDSQRFDQRWSYPCSLLF